MAVPALESAIPPYLQRERTLQKSAAEDYQPPFPAYTARFPESVKNLVVAIIGAQHNTKPQESALSKILPFCDNSGIADDVRPGHFTTASHNDNQGFYNEVVISYWNTKHQFEAWKHQSGFETWWQSIDADAEPCGFFLEVLLPPIERFETVFSDNVQPEGAAHMREGISGPIREHIYWGSMRDRLPAAQNDNLVGEQAFEPNTSGGSTDSSYQQKELKGRVKISGRQNLAVIRSGQDWSNTTPNERKLYLDTMHPVLVRGMDFLRDQGEEVGCFSCRFMEEMDSHSLQPRTTEKTFGLAFFNDLAALEDWSKTHKTHLDIFGRFLQYAKELGNNVSLRLFHEVMVLESGQQQFEYVGCHSKTGMLASR